MNVKIITIFTLCFLSLSNFGQEIGSSGWFSVIAKKKLSKNTTLKTELGFRESTINDKTRYLDLALKYKINKHLKLSGGYRYGLDKENFDYFETGHRFNIDLSTKYSIIKKLKFNYRFRFQKRYSNPFTSDLGHLPNNNFRNRLSLRYKQNKKLYFVGGTELFIKQNYSTTPFFNKIRGLAGADYKINKKQTISISYIYQQEIQVTNPKTQNILSLEYYLDF
ncbi:MAG: DUF2490 domain-containing protein [Flavobacteriales bacterium]|jgi:hypothetical protein|nr:DUF2490 domain-containing protein [Flavobacteriales bacterium]